MVGKILELKLNGQFDFFGRKINNNLD
uniref:Uncharacterized protein n=1 Tax=Anguilla anguilla TaxID=7936 RepID=A0A0E9UNW1_ANGAN